MAQRDLEVVRRIYEAAARRDTETVLALYAPEIEWDMSAHPMSRMLQQKAIRRGREEIRDWFREWYEVFEDYAHPVDELIDAGDHVVSVGTDTGRGRASGIEVQQQVAGVWTVRDGQVVRVVWYPTREEALRAANADPQAP